MKDEGVIFGERERVGCERVEFRMFQTQGRLNVAASLPLAKDVGDVVGAESLRGKGLLESGGDTLRAVVADQLEQFTNLPCETAVRFSELAKVVFRRGPQQTNEALLRGRALRCGELCEQLLLEALGSERAPALPAAAIGNDLFGLVVDRDRRGVGFDREFLTHIPRRHTVAVAVETHP